MKKIILLVLTVFFGVCSYGQDTTFSNSFHSGNTIFSVNDKVGLLNRDKKLIIPCMYDDLSDISYGLVKATLNRKVGFVDVNNKTIIPFEYEEDTNIIIGARIYRTLAFDDKGNVTQTSLSVMVDRHCINFSDGLCAVIKNGNYGFIDTLGNTVIPFKFDGADNFTNDIAIVKTGGKYGAIDNNGKLVIPAVYDALVVDTDEQGLYARKDGEMFLIDFKGVRKKGDVN